jgi:hypothetical protein
MEKRIVKNSDNAKSQKKNILLQNDFYKAGRVEFCKMTFENNLSFLAKVNKCTCTLQKLTQCS